jgi:hypothetical protein
MDLDIYTLIKDSAYCTTYAETIENDEVVYKVNRGVKLNVCGISVQACTHVCVLIVHSIL